MLNLRPKIQEAIKLLPNDLSKPITAICSSPDFNASISAKQFSDLMRHSMLSDSKLRLALLPVAAAYAFVPISRFYVGAIARGSSGTLYFGANMEFQHLALQNTLHAEQSAISHAWLKGEESITDITINYSPCGHCRQFMNELNSIDNMDIQLPDQPEKKLAHFLPHAFGPTDLGVMQGLLGKLNHGFAQTKNDSLLSYAIDALNKSYAPYSQSYSAIALECDDSRLFQGRYAENAAFNPSLSPLNMALNSMNLAQVDFNKIVRATLVETNGAKISQFENTKAMLSMINTKIDFDYVKLDII